MRQDLESFQLKLKESISFFVGLGMSMVSSYHLMCPSLKAVGMYDLLIAARSMNCQVTRAVRLQEMWIPEVTQLDLIETKGKLQNLLTYLEQGDFDLELTYKYSEKSSPLFEPEEIVEEENLDLGFPEKECMAEYTNARKLLISRCGELFHAVVSCISGVLEKLERLIRDCKNLKRNAEIRTERMEAMEQFYLKHNWPEEKQKVIQELEWELKNEANKGKTDVQIIKAMIRSMETDHEKNCEKKMLKLINQHKHDRGEVARIAAENRELLSLDDMMSHLHYRESIKLLNDRIAAIVLLAPCNAYQGKLFATNAAYELAKMLGRAFYNYVGFDKKIKAAFVCMALMDFKIMQREGCNSTIVVEFVNSELLGENDDAINKDAINKPFRKCLGHPFCTIDEDDLRDFTKDEFEKYKELYWRAFSIINMVLGIGERIETAAYLASLHPIIEEVDVVGYLDSEEKTRLQLVSSLFAENWK